MDQAISALGMIGNAEAARALAGAWKSAPENVRLTAAESYGKCAERLLAAGKTAEATAIYRELSHPGPSRAIRRLAVRGLLKTAGDEAGGMILEFLANDDADAQSAALGLVPDLPPGAVKRLGSDLATLPPPTQALLLGMLAERGEAAILPAATRCAQSAEESLKIAGLIALGQVGDASSLPLLLGALTGTGPVADAARASLTRVKGPTVEGEVVSAMQAERDAARRGVLIEVLEMRGTTACVPALLQEAVAEISDLRRKAMHALGRLARTEDVPGMIKGLLKAGRGGERDDAGRAISLVCGRAGDPDNQSAPLLQAYAQGAPADRLALLPVLGRVGGAKALDVVKNALASNDAPTSDAAATALANWPDSDEAVENEILALVQRAKNPNDRASALRAYVRVIALPSGLPEKARLKKFQQAMELAGRDQERNLVLERVADVRHIETLRFVVPYLDTSATAQRACNTVFELVRQGTLRDPKNPEVKQALQKVLEVSKNQALLERVNRYLQGK